MTHSFHHILNPDRCACNRAIRIEKVHRFPFLANSPARTRMAISMMMTQRCMEQGEEFSPFEHQGASFGVVVSGALKVYRYVEDERYIILDVLGAGDFFVYTVERDERIGMYSYPDQIASLTTTCVVSMSRAQLEKTLIDDPTLAVSLFGAISARLARVHDRQATCLGLDAEQSVAFLLTHLLEMRNDADRDTADIPGLIPFNLSRKDLASMAGLTLETVSRILAGFERNGMVSTGRSWVRVDDARAVAGIVKSPDL